MKASLLPVQTRKTRSESNEPPSQKLLTQSGFIIKHGAGLYTYGPLAVRVLAKIREIIKRELDRIGCFEIAMPFVQPATLWEESGRLGDMGPEMARMQDRRDAHYVLSPTHEEVITDVFRKTVTSWKTLPTCLYQIGLKFRDEIRPRFGLLRAREFLMMDAYSFHLEQESLDEYYEVMFSSYETIFTQFGVRFRPVDAFVGTMGGDSSHEFHVLADVGEDELIECGSCDGVSNAELWRGPEAPESAEGECPRCSSRDGQTSRGIEVGHIFKLGSKYTESMRAKLQSGTGGSTAPVMGCYGIGLSRTMASIVEQRHDDKGMIWPRAVAPFDLYLIDMLGESEHALVTSLYDALRDKGFDVYWDDRKKGFGQKMGDWELFGIPMAVVASKDLLTNLKLEVFFRDGRPRDWIEGSDVTELVARALVAFRESA